MVSGNKEEKMQRICELYEIVKELIIYAEEVNEAKKANINAINELRNAFDHLMRVHIMECGVNRKKSSEYIEKNLEKCYGHIYRAGYDTLDLLSITLKMRINKIMDEFSNNTIETVFPEYFTYATELNQLDEDIADMRNKKDVGDSNYENFISYAKYLNRLKKYHRLVLSKRSVMLEHKRKGKREDGKKIFFQMIISLVLLIAGGLITMYIMPVV